MNSKKLFIWVEGPDDVRFFEAIIKPKFLRKYCFVEVRQYADMKKGKLCSFVKSIIAMGGDYIFSGDINQAPCVNIRKEKLRERYNILDENRIIIIIKEIESWYLAGITNDFARKYKIKLANRTEQIVKEQFKKLIPKKFDSKTDFLVEILKIFSTIEAMGKNTSFKYLIDKYNL